MTIAIFFIICIVIFFAPPKWDAESGIAAIIDKHSRLEQRQSPKIIFIGGSNVLMGLDSAEIQKAFKRDVVNMGLGISLGLRYQLEEIRDQINPGDLIVVMPEYCNFYFLSKDITNAHLNGSSDLIHIVQIYPRAWRWVWAVYSSSPKALLGGLAMMCGDFCVLKLAFIEKQCFKLFVRLKDFFIKNSSVLPTPSLAIDGI
jgi:hypothetical protein